MNAPSDRHETIRNRWAAETPAELTPDELAQLGELQRRRDDDREAADAVIGAIVEVINASPLPAHGDHALLWTVVADHHASVVEGYDFSRWQATRCFWSSAYAAWRRVRHQRRRRRP